jgi:hypothetical protein
MISIGESSAEFLFCRTFPQNPVAGNRVFAKLFTDRDGGLDRLDAELFVLMILSRTAQSAAAFGGLRSLTKSSTRTETLSKRSRPLFGPFNNLDR